MLHVTNLVKDYYVSEKKHRILDKISFSVADGEILGITGKSGSGKSTLLRILRGIEKFDAGTIELEGHIFNSHSNDDELRFLISNSAIHLQRNFGLWNGPAIENVIRKIHARKEGNEGLPEPDSPYYEEMYKEAMHYLKQVSLENKALHTTSALSGGEKQRLILARQLAALPKLLLLDEPVTMTGPGTKQEILDVIIRLKDKLQIPIIVVSHLPEVHMYLADKLIYLENGKIAAEGDPKSVIKLFFNDLKPPVKLTPHFLKDPVIKVKDISKRLVLIRVGEVLNFNHLSFDIYKSEIVSLIGASGTGKTTILKMLEGFVSPNSGEILYLNNGEWVDINHFNSKRTELRKKISIMHQEFTLSPHSTIAQQIGFRLRIKGPGSLEYARRKAHSIGVSEEILDLLYALPDMVEEEKEKIIQQNNINPQLYSILFPKINLEDVQKQANKIFKALDLNMDILYKTPAQISGGEHVRTYIALALITEPEILILDEPFGDLDPITLRDVTNSLKKINQQYGTTIILVSHHMNFVTEVSHRAILIENGKITMDGDPYDVSHHLIEVSKATYLKKGIKSFI